MRQRVAVGFATGIILTLLALFVAWPLVRILQTSLTAGNGAFTLGHYREFFGTWLQFRLLLNTLALAVTSTAVTVGLAALLAYAVTRTTMPGRRLVAGLTVVPLIFPPFLAALALVLLLGRNGVVPRWLGLAGSIDGFPGLVVAQVLTFLPYAYLAVANVLAAIHGDVEAAAENLGAGELMVLRRVTLGLARPGLAAAALTVFVLCMADFGNPLLIGGRYDVLATEIYARTMWKNNFASAATMSVVLVVPCLVAWALGAYRAGGRPLLTVSPSPGAGLRTTGPAAGRALAALCGGIALVILLVYAAIPAGSIVAAWGTDWSLSTAHYALAASAERGRSLRSSATLAVLAAAVGAAIALVTAYVIERTRPYGARAVETLSALPAALPGTVVGLGYLLAFHWPPILLTGTIWVLVASVVFWKLPIAVLAARAALRRIDAATEEAAVSLGAGRLGTLVRVTVPRLAGTAVTIAGYFFVEGMVTVSAVIFLIYRGFDPASVEILAQVDDGKLGTACALATMVVAIVAAVGLGLRAAVRRRGERA